MYGCNLSDSDKAANGRKLSAAIKESAAGCEVNETVWEIMHLQNGRRVDGC